MTMTATAPYTPAGGLEGKLRRLSARLLGVSPLTVSLDKPLISFSFDDFPRSAGEAGADILEASGWRATYYAAGGFAGGVTHLGEMYDFDQLSDLAARGHEIACHTYAHPDLSRLSATGALAECARNRDTHARIKGAQPFETFAFPYGEATPGAKRGLLGVYRALRGVRPGVNRGRVDRGLLKAVPLDGGEFGLARALRAIADVRAEPGWLIFYGHDVSNSPSQWGCSPRFLETVCQACEGLDVRPVARALDHVEATA
jgi:peptidoglycan/xylan/chitin deacetylase (PgdA/CDA1 family)